MVKPKGWRGNSRGHSIAAMKGARRRASGSKAQYGISNKKRDALFTAKRPGKRRSTSGKTYYEYRRNRSDV